MWIEFAEKKEYENSSRLTGLRISIDKRIDAGRKQGIRKFVEWLRKRYYFPIRCNIYIRYCSYFKKMDDSDVDSIGDFYYSDNKLPIIWIAGYPRKKTEDKDFYVQINASIVYFLRFIINGFFVNLINVRIEA